MKHNKKRKYKMGGKMKYAIGGTALNQKSPNEIVQNFQLMSQQAKAESMLGPVQDLRAAAGVASQIGSSLTSQGMQSISPDAGGITGFLKNNHGLIEDIQNIGFGASFGGGGTVPQNVYSTDPVKKGVKKEVKKKDLGNPFPKKSIKYRALNKFVKIGETRKATVQEFEALKKVMNNDARFNKYIEEQEMFSMGGSTGSTNIEAEGEEVFETPDGMVAEIMGPSHENGGVDMNLPEGTDIYSKRVKGPDGKTMAERKKKREKTINSLEKLMDNNPTDKFLKKTLKTITENNEYVDTQDVNTMNLFRTLEEAVQKFQTGGTVGPIFGRGMKKKFQPYLNQYSQFDPNFDINNIDSRKQLQSNLGLVDDGVFGKNTLKALSGFDFKPRQQARTLENRPQRAFTASNLEAGGFDTMNEIPGLANTPFAGGGDEGGSGILGDIFNGIKGSGVTLGDAVGLFGRNQAANQGVDLVNRQRAGDTPNINAFKNFGQDALEAIEQSKGYIGQQQDAALRDIDNSRASSVRRNRASARSVGTQRALDLASSRQADRGVTDVYNNFSQQMMAILNQQAGFENQQDLRVMQGEQNRDLADRQDRDNYFTQLSKAQADQATGRQHIGKDLNQIKGRNVGMNLINQLSKYGLKFDSKGNLIKN